MRTYNQLMEDGLKGITPIERKKVFLVSSTIETSDSVEELTAIQIERSHTAYSRIKLAKQKEGKPMGEINHLRAMVRTVSNNVVGFQKGLGKVKSGIHDNNPKHSMMIITMESGNTVRMKKDKEVFNILRQSKLDGKPVYMNVQYDQNDISSHYGWNMKVQTETHKDDGKLIAI